MSKFNKGDIGIIVSNSGSHEFPIGTQVRKIDNQGKWDYLDSSDYWYIPNEDDVGTICQLSSHDQKDNTQYNTISKPEHYNHGDGIECIEYIKQVLGPEGFIAYCRGNLMKYNHRAMYKGKPVEDLEKAEQYLKWAIETLRENGENR